VKKTLFLSQQIIKMESEAKINIDQEMNSMNWAREDQQTNTNDISR
jgi:hypothetical protein